MNNIENDYMKIDLKEFNDSKRTHFIFGKNGSGKTTIAREIKKSELMNFVYNRDFIFENIYEEILVSGEIEANQKPENKSNSFSIFFGKEAQILLSKRNEYLDKKKELIESINQSLEVDEKYKPFLKLANIRISTDIKFSKIKNAKEKADLKNAKKISNAKLIEMEEIAKNIHSLQTRNILIGKWNDLNNKIKSLNNLSKKYNDVLNLDSTDSVIYDVHKMASEYEKDTFIWMRKEYKVKDIELYLKELSNAKATIIKETLNAIDLLLKNIETIESDTQYSKVFQQNHNIEIRKLKKEIEKEKINVDKEKTLNSVSCLNKIEKEEQKKLSDVISSKLGDNKYSWVKNLNEAKKTFAEIEDNDKLIEEITQTLAEKQAKIEEKSEKTINEHLSILTADKLKVKLETKTTATKSYTEIVLLNGMDISKLSDGEKNSLAFAYFLVYLEKELAHVKEDFCVVIDDPFDSNDHYKIDSFRDVKFTFSGKKVNLSELIWRSAKKNKVSSKYIFMTHDIATLSSMAIGFIDKYECKKDFHFMPISSKFYKNLEVYNLLNTSNKESMLEVISLSHFFPNEVKIAETFSDIFKKIWKSEITLENLWAIKVASIFLCKYYDKTDNEYRLFHKAIVMDILANNKIPTFDEINGLIPQGYFEEIGNLNKDSYDVLKSNENKIVNIDNNVLKSFLKDSIDKEELKYYIEFFIDHINSVINETDINLKDKKMKRLRHKNNYQYSLISYAIED